MMKLLFYISLIPLVLTMSLKDYEDCWTRNNTTITNKYGVLVNFASTNHSEKENCSMEISNPWAVDIQNGFALFPTAPIDCSSMITIECLSDGIFIPQTIPSSIQYTCHTKTYKMLIMCNSIKLTYQQNSSIEQSKKSINLQIVALAKEPCKDNEIFFQCIDDYPQSCLNRILQCNGRSECPNGYDERYCQQPSAAGVPIIVIILAILAFLVLICILSSVLACLCCRAAFHAIVHRLWPGTVHKSLEKGEIVVATGEDAGLMKDLTNPNILTPVSDQRNEPATLVIDSTKPVYPRLQ